MRALLTSGIQQANSSVAAEASDAQMVSSIRLLLSISAVLALSVDPTGLSGVAHPKWAVFGGYAVYSAVVWSFARLNHSLASSRGLHWLDVAWFLLIVLFTEGGDSNFYLFFLFAILTSSFRWGFEEGARVTLVSSFLFTACDLGIASQQDLARLLLKTTFLLTLGYMSAYWGGSQVELKRRLVLLRDVSHMSNPRFGVDHTIASALRKTHQFFTAESCLLVLRERESSAYSLRSVFGSDPEQGLQAQRLNEDMALPLLDAMRNQVVAYRRAAFLPLPSLERSAVYDEASSRWRKDHSRAALRLAELLEAGSFISAPLKTRRGDGRIYVLSQEPGLRRSDALFLKQIAAQVFPVIDNVELLDRMASNAASQERQKIALDIHDNAIQPYIGLKLGLSALRNRAAPDNPLIDELDKLGAMAAQVIDDLRRYAGTVKHGAVQQEQTLSAVLRQQAEQVRDFYGIDLAVEVDREIHVSDRLTAEVMQIVREGLSNICKHTTAQRGAIRLQRENQRLVIDIENEYAGVAFAAFTPRSISERATALGGSTRVGKGSGGGTVIQVKIPI